jgi:hypothetical protein
MKLEERVRPAATPKPELASLRALGTGTNALARAALLPCLFSAIQEKSPTTACCWPEYGL